MDGFSAVARILKLEGVEWVACYPSNNLIESVAQEGIRTVMFRHERGAVMAADGYQQGQQPPEVWRCDYPGRFWRRERDGRYRAGVRRQRADPADTRRHRTCRLEHQAQLLARAGVRTDLQAD